MRDLALAHVRHHQPVRDLGPHQPEQQHVEDRVVVVNVLKKYNWINISIDIVT